MADTRGALQMGKSFRKQLNPEGDSENYLPEGVDVLQKCQAIRKSSFLPEGVGAVGSYEVLPADRQEVPGRGYQGRECGDSRRRF